ncbi:MAG: Trk system potassium transporter TrkA [Desulfobacter sp.]|nr:MAG: Trk system potassium transporter TrkA [Desulfobacter sp.]
MRVLIIGAGQVGYTIADRLASEHNQVTVIDKDACAIRRLYDNLDVHAVHASSTSPKALEDAGLKNTQLLLAVTDSDEINIMACMLADYLSPDTKKLARIRNVELDSFHHRFMESTPHIDTIINPETEVVRAIGQLMRIPGITDLGELVEGRVSYAGFRIHRASEMVGMQLSSLSARNGIPHPLIAAIIRDRRIIVPKGDAKFFPEDLVYMICEKKHLEKNLNLFGFESRTVASALIVGGGRIGKRLAKKLVQEGVETKIIESDRTRCEALSHSLNNVLILHGSGSDLRLLLEENIPRTDVVVPVTDDDEANILMSLLAKTIGAGDTITKIGNTGYLPLLPAIGIDKVVSPRLSAIGAILRDVRKGNIISDISILGEQGEFIEVIALDKSSITRRPVKQVNFPKGTLLLIVIRGDQVLIPTGDTIVTPGDRLVFFAVNQAVKKLERLLTIKEPMGN